MKKRSTLPLSLGILSLTSLLAACGHAPAPNNPDPLTPHMSALTLGDVNGKVISNLKNTSLEKYTGAQDLKNYDLLIVDGDTSNAEIIKTHPLIRRALALHKPLLFVDVSENHKKNGVGKLIGFNTKGTSDGYLVVPVTQASGKTFYHIYTTSIPMPNATGGLQSSGPTDTTANDSAFAASIARNIANAHQAPLKVQDANTSIQPVQQQWSVTDTISGQPPATGYGVTTPQPFAGTATVTYTLFQDLSTNITSGGTQKLVVTTDASGDPGSMVVYNDFEEAWFLGAVNIWNQFTTASGDNGGLTFFKAGPIAENQSNTYSSGTSFNIGLSKDGPSGGFTWDSSQSHDIPDWAVSADYSLNNKTNWRFKSASPDVDNTSCTYGFECTFWNIHGGSGPTKPNALSTSLSQYHTETVFANNALSSTSIDVESDVVFWLYNMYHKDGNYPVKTYPVGYSHTGTIDLSAVIPQQPTITYNYASAPTNSTVMGAVVLPNTATGDQTVYLKAVGTSNTGIAIPAYVIVPAGSRLANFPISISNDQVSTSMTVQANFGQYSTQALLPVAQTAFTLPANNLTPDPNNWAETVSDAPATSNWKTGNLVRYAVAYVDGNGTEVRGPYSNWIEIGQYALPYLTQVPIGPSGTVTRKYYRQFFTGNQTITDEQFIMSDTNLYPTQRDSTW